MLLDLNRCKWMLKGFWPFTPLFGKSMETEGELMGVTEWIDATVPGGVQHDLARAGIIEDYHYELNSLKCEWVEHRWWMYRTGFRLPQEFFGRKLTLVFKGLDYKAHIFLNGAKLAEHEAMFETVTLDVTDRIDRNGENELSVLFENAPSEIAQIGYTSLVRTQKSRFSYKWDFCTRLVNIGIWDDVFLKASGDICIKDEYIHTDADGDEGLVHITCTLQGQPDDVCFVKTALDYDGQSIAADEEQIILTGESVGFTKLIRVPKARLWYPNGSGEQPLYTARIEVYQNGVLSDKRVCKIGIRRLEYRQNPGSSADSLPYLFVINDTPVYIKGVNLTPFDLMYGNITNGVYDRYVKLLKLCNVNMVRINGIGVIEKEYFYQLCDRNGILVWQDFIQSGSGIDSVPSSDPQYLGLLEKSSAQALRDKRNHVSHAVWCGGNELSYRHVVPLGFEDPNIKMLRDLVQVLDPGKLFLPSTPSGPMFSRNAEYPEKNHDVHGGWKYEGIEKHYRLQNNYNCLFHSEFGVDGMSSPVSLRRFLGERNLCLTNMSDNLVWRHHGEWWDTLKRDKGIFGEFDSLKQFVKASQFIQAEGLRFVVESNRRRQFRNSGSIIWQFNEPWPNVSCTSLVDYYSIPKMAYYWTRNAYSRVHVSLEYSKLNFPYSEPFCAAVYVHNDGGDQQLSVSWDILEGSGRILSSGESPMNAPSGSVQMFCNLNLTLPHLPSEVFFVRLKLNDEAGRPLDSNLYIFSQKEDHIFAPLLHPAGSRLQVEKREECYRIKNTGEAVCLFIHDMVKTGNTCVFIDDDYFSLFPGEERNVRADIVDAQVSRETYELVIEWDYLNS